MAHETRPGDGRTDAELLKQMAKNASEGGPWKDWTSFVDQACQRGLEYLSGTRPMPTDEVAALTARVAELEALVKVLREGGRPIGDRPFTIAPDGQDHKYWSGTTDLGATFSKPAPGAEGGE